MIELNVKQYFELVTRPKTPDRKIKVMGCSSSTFSIQTRRNSLHDSLRNLIKQKQEPNEMLDFVNIVDD